MFSRLLIKTCLPQTGAGWEAILFRFNYVQLLYCSLANNLFNILLVFWYIGATLKDVWFARCIDLGEYWADHYLKN